MSRKTKFVIEPVHEKGSVTVCYDFEMLGLVVREDDEERAIIMSLRAAECRTLAAGLVVVADAADAENYVPIEERAP